jgi:hypothetical protein
MKTQKLVIRLKLYHNFMHFSFKALQNHSRHVEAEFLRASWISCRSKRNYFLTQREIWDGVFRACPLKIAYEITVRH